jgi:hypothetical protein
MKLLCYLLSLFGALLSSSCMPCTKKACLEIHNVGLQFIGFDRSEIDTIHATGYALGGGFSQVTTPQRLDTVSVQGSDSAYYYRSMDNYDGLSDNQDWEIHIPAVNLTYRISGYTYHTYSCNNCPFHKDDKVTSLSSCTINGVRQSTSDATIYK